MIRTNACLLLIAVIASALGGCSSSTAAPQDADALATIVSSTLTAMPPAPEATLPPVPTEPPPQPTATEVKPSPTPSPTTLPTETPTPTPTIEPTGTLPAGDVLATLGGATWRDDFSTGSNWSVGEDSFTRARVQDGEFHMTGLTTTDGWRLTWPEVSNFYLEMAVTTGSCTGNDHYGLIVRVPDRSAANRGYLVGLTCDGRYSLRSWDGESMTQLVSLTASEAIHTGSEQVNRLGIWARGEKLGLYVNGKLLRETTDSTFVEEGSFGIWVGARQTENFTIRVDEIAYWNNP